MKVLILLTKKLKLLKKQSKYSIIKDKTIMINTIYFFIIYNKIPTYYIY